METTVEKVEVALSTLLVSQDHFFFVRRKKEWDKGFLGCTWGWMLSCTYIVRVFPLVLTEGYPLRWSSTCLNVETWEVGSSWLRSNCSINTCEVIHGIHSIEAILMKTHFMYIVGIVILLQLTRKVRAEQLSQSQTGFSFLFFELDQEAILQLRGGCRNL